ncbi:MAG: VanZ family protein [Caldilineaceae bacterium]|nr:VanZ family protein [Caldilineaceae bacterium]MBP8107464.1 VanZ family protein [Caldilineaceae bacterium]MBP8122387.1 VanZ family protein [Caldilineaceae bacterium]MBP9073563.1 VanZ family protein [Caldilineaceae bacterium]
MTSTRKSAGIPLLREWGRGVMRYVSSHDPVSWSGWAITWGPVLGVIAVIFWLSSLSEPFGSEPVWFDEVIGITGHFCEFGLLALAWRWALMRQWPGLRYPVWIALALTLLLALGDEFHQNFVPGRFSDPLDVFTDLAGAVTALGFWGKVKG